MYYSLPMWLTFSRIAAIPVLVALFWAQGDEWRYVACAVYGLAAATDWLDGYLARAWAQQSKLGRMLDPIADKLLVAAVILLLVAFDRISAPTIVAALVILLREVLVSGLREFLAELRVGLPVSAMAKWKTAAQMTALGFLVVADAEPTAFLPVSLIGETLLWIAAGLTLYTGYDYLRVGLKHADDAPAPPAPESKPSAEPSRHSA
ncbi:MAG: CDP-diacylglycerol--glycerol-3-phosphate 3-phosphatidyltransferase [Tagaea sp.]|jgi:cardiolipin synthase|nr:CDP-diacylglycerol--glycerol-3-phosphate 3-phosphatidyltransferase [Azospirillum sp.]MCA3266539.1 CDP-diacylglycerol--glycerol-3-phosphate 3-phosphatidyltransferase [Azospirillum sp.]MCZ8123386.1 CDP-diacylglycerol--glycerol-3-phosphate 3-phosphatidyltransferase [Magnetospirillum sp.]